MESIAVWRHLCEGGLVVAAALVAMTVDSGWAGFSWALIVALGGGLVWLIRLEGRVNTAEKLAAQATDQTSHRFAALEATLEQHHREKREDFAQLHKDIESLRSLIVSRLP